MRFHVDQRHERVLALVRERGSLRVADLAGELGVSAVTLRRDVETLATQGRLRRVHGSVVWPGATAGAAPDTAPAPAGVRDAEGVVAGMVVPTLDCPFGEIVEGARDALEARGGRLVLGLCGHAEGDAEQAGRLVAAGADGLLLTCAPAPGPDSGGWIPGTGVPVVLVERAGPPGSRWADLDHVRSDAAHGAATAVRHLVSLGHHSVALVLREAASAEQLRAGHAAAVKALELTPAPGSPYVASARLPEAERIERTAEHLRALAEEHGVRAVLLHGDEFAVVLVPRLRALGVLVPEDLAIVVHGDQVASLADPPLTAVAPPNRAVGEAAVALLLERLAEDRRGDRGPRRHVELLPALRVRASCGAVLRAAGRA
ncbi:substrate-binding domain-containing protein [Streptomyces sp. MI02-7b]|uniref:substrate-binding domain-containing protein n=1 Tax=Streptomyces sp. MI02-7b TaxID=462941 RepID=UPI0029B36245|nr:substrate-binding domain-containing protein [Streptomyces sp. MI02-7b]MDX3072194.1 substrate-binding domain-containing protein [Streptomyces sp. MI02-7b]